MADQKIDNTPKWVIVLIYVLLAAGTVMLVWSWFVTSTTLFYVLCIPGAVFMLAGIALTGYYAGEYILDNKRTFAEEKEKR